jgi:hypothetical protein
MVVAVGGDEGSGEGPVGEDLILELPEAAEL